MNEEVKSYIYEYNGFDFTVYINDYWERIYKGKPRNKLYHDYQVMLEYTKKVDKHRIIMDVGVNNGLFAIPASKLGYKVLGFEPVKSNYQNLMQAKHVNSLFDFNFQVFNLALSNQNSILDIYIPECLDNASFSRDAAIANMKRKDFTVEQVQAVRFDDWIKANPEFRDIGLIKIDVQGAEWSVIDGMKEFLTQAQNIYIIIEMEDHLLKQGHTYEELDDLIRSCGYIDLGKITGGDKLWFRA